MATDETWFGESDAARTHGRAPKGERVDEYVKSIYHQKRLCIVGACTSNGIIHGATFITEEKMVTEIYTWWFKHKLLENLVAGMAVMIDNAPFHDFPALSALADAAGVWLLPTPPRCPEDNPIELVWAALDKLLKAGGREAFGAAPHAAILKALYDIGQAEVKKCFGHCGVGDY